MKKWALVAFVALAVGVALPVGVHGIQSATGADFQIRRPADCTPVSTSTDLTSDPNPSACGQKVTLTATVTPAGATGSVTFYEGATSLGAGAVDGTGVATLSVTDFAGGSHTLSATYEGDACNLSSTSPDLKHTVGTSTSVSLTSDVNPSVCGDKVNVTATVTPATATGTVTFYDSGNPLGVVTLDNTGHATISLQAELYTATIALTGVYSGDECDAPSVSPPYDQVVTAGPSSVVLTASPSPSACGEGVTLDATLTPATVIGTVEFFDGATSLGTAPADLGHATLVVSFTGAGSHVLTAHFGGDYCTTPSTSAPIKQDVNPATTTVSLISDVNPGTCGQNVTFTATVHPGATGTVTFYDGATPIGSASVDGFGAAHFSTSTLGLGPHTITAVYGGDGCYSGATSQPLTLVINPVVTETSLTSTPNPSSCGQKVTLTAIVRTPNGGGNGIVAKGGFHADVIGTVTFYDGADPLGSATVVDSVATLSATTLTPGSHTLTAVFGGSACVGSSTSPGVKQDVSDGPTTTTLTSDVNPSKFGGKVNLTANVYPSPGPGTVSFYDGATLLGTAMTSNGSATLSVTSLGVGSHALTAVYEGDGCFAPSTSPVYTQDVTADDPPHVTVIFPNGGETLCIGSDVKLRWTATDNTQVVSVMLEYSLDYGVTWQTIATGVPNTGSYVWTVPPPGTIQGNHEVFSASFRVTATDNAGAQGSDRSDDFFSIPDCVVDVSLVRLETEPSEAGIVISWTLPAPERFTSLAMERATASSGPWTEIQPERHQEGDRSVAVDATAAPAQSYWYRLVGRTASGSSVVFGPVEGRAAAPRAFALAAVWPNPTAGDVTAQFSLPRSAAIRLSVLDLQGREVQVLAQGVMAPGRYQTTWDGRTDRGRVAEGVYFVRYATPDLKLIKRIVIAR